MLDEQGEEGAGGDVAVEGVSNALVIWDIYCVFFSISCVMIWLVLSHQRDYLHWKSGLFGDGRLGDWKAALRKMWWRESSC